MNTWDLIGQAVGRPRENTPSDFAASIVSGSAVSVKQASFDEQLEAAAALIKAVYNYDTDTMVPPESLAPLSYKPNRNALQERLQGFNPGPAQAGQVSNPPGQGLSGHGGRAAMGGAETEKEQLPQQPGDDEPPEAHFNYHMASVRHHMQRAVDAKAKMMHASSPETAPLSAGQAAEPMGV